MSDTLLIGIIVFCGVIILAQMAVIYGLVNRLIRANGQTEMNAKRAFDEMIEKTVGTSESPETAKKRIVKESYRIGV